MKARIGVLLVLTACSGLPEAAETPQVITLQEAAQAADAASAAAEEQLTVEALRGRVDEYERVKRDARARGVFAGVLRGTLLGAVIAGEQGAVVGAVLGGAVGAAAAETVTAGLIVEHEGYLLQRHSIEKVIAAAQADTRAIETDVDLLRKYSGAVAARGAGGGGIDLTHAHHRSARADVAKLVSLAEERTRNLLIVTEALAAQGEDVTRLRAEQARQAALHTTLRDMVSGLSGAAGEVW